MKKYTEDDLVKLYREYASIPQPKTASILPSVGDGRVRTYTTWSVRDLDRFENISFSLTYIGKSSDMDFTSCSFPAETSKELLSAISHCGQFRAVVKRYTNKKKAEKEIIEIWSKDTKQRTIDLESQDAHGKVYEDAQFGSLQWSYSGKKLIYIAEKKRPLSQSFFKKREHHIVPGEENIHREDWGEQLVGKHQPVICILDLSSETVHVIDSLPDGVSPGQAIWAPKDEGILFIGWQEEPRRLGLVYCKNRRSLLYYANLETGEVSVISRESASVWSARVSPDQNTVVYLESEESGPHQNCYSLIKCDRRTRKTSVLIQPVEKPRTESDFPGLFVDGLPQRCWTNDSKKIIFHGTWRSKQELLCVDVSSGTVTRLTSDPEIGAWTLLDMDDDLLVASRSSFNVKPHLAFGKLQATDDDVTVSWFPIELSRYVLDGVDWRIISLQPPDSDEFYMQYEALFVKPKNESTEKLPLIVFPHGGPHSQFSPCFSLFVILWIKCGFSVLLVNYRGSTGFGKSQLYSLLGNVGTQDVEDVAYATELITKQEEVDTDRIAICGGSHGGFLATHLIGQKPDVFKVCVCRNPVVNIGGKQEGTDIPDWGWVEAGCADKFSFDSLPTPDVLSRMWSHSPFQYIKNVKAPTLMLLGKIDRRVPPTQGLSYYRTLKALGVITRLYEYEDNHALAEVDVESDCFMHTMLWLQKYLP